MQLKRLCFLFYFICLFNSFLFAIPEALIYGKTPKNLNVPLFINDSGVLFTKEISLDTTNLLLNDIKNKNINIIEILSDTLYSQNNLILLKLDTNIILLNQIINQLDTSNYNLQILNNNSYNIIDLLEKLNNSDTINFSVFDSGYFNYITINGDSVISEFVITDRIKVYNNERYKMIINYSNGVLLPAGLITNISYIKY